jgi:nitrite reductase/ring-hydroxylating ferredoxin subunit/uncharacterized membrane protein
LVAAAIAVHKKSEVIMLDRTIDAITNSQWMSRTADQLGDAVKHAYAGAGHGGLQLKSALNGVWLGHPLHPALTDIPLGAWTTAVAFDAAGVASGREELAGCASAAIAIGLAGAVASAAAGITDWSDTDGRARRVGLIHGTLNLAATGLFAASLVMRRRARDGRGRACAVLGYALALGAAYLGGSLVYGDQIGVNHAAGHEVPEEFTPALAFSELGERHPRRVMIGMTPVLLVRDGDRVYAMAETCSHLGGPLSEGTLENGAVVCPWHGSSFALDDGHVVNGPATHRQPCFEARVRDGQVEVRMPKPPDASKSSEF